MNSQKKCFKCSFEVLHTWLFCPMCSNSLTNQFPIYQHQQYNIPNDQAIRNRYIPIQLQLFDKPLVNPDSTESENLYKLINSIYNFFDYDHQGILTYQKITNYMNYIEEPVKTEQELSVALEATGCELTQDGLTRKGFHQYQLYFLKTDSPKWQKEMKKYFKYDIPNILLPSPLTPEQKANEEKRILDRAQQILNMKMSNANAVNQISLQAVDMVRKAATPPGTYFYKYYY